MYRYFFFFNLSFLHKKIRLCLGSNKTKCLQSRCRRKGLPSWALSVEPDALGQSVAARAEGEQSFKHEEVCRPAGEQQCSNQHCVAEQHEGQQLPQDLEEVDGKGVRHGSPQHHGAGRMSGAGCCLVLLCSVWRRSKGIECVFPRRMVWLCCREKWLSSGGLTATQPPKQVANYQSVSVRLVLCELVQTFPGLPSCVQCWKGVWDLNNVSKSGLVTKQTKIRMHV